MNFHRKNERVTRCQKATKHGFSIAKLSPGKPDRVILKIKQRLLGDEQHSLLLAK